MSDDYRDEKGRLKPGAPPLYKGKQAQPEPQPDIPFAEPFLGNLDNLDDVIIYVSRNYGRQGLPSDGPIGYYVNMMEERAADFHLQHGKAVARKAELASPADGFHVEVIHVGMIPSGHYVTAEQMADIQAADFSNLPSVEPLPSPPAKPVLLDDDEDYDEPPYTMEEVNRMSKAEFDAAVAAGEIVVVEKER